MLHLILDVDIDICEAEDHLELVQDAHSACLEQLLPRVVLWRSLRKGVNA